MTMLRFRWVTCQIDALKDCLDHPRLRKALRNLPTTLYDTYTRILENIPREHIQQTMTILSLLIWTQHKLTIPELVDAIAVNLDEDPKFDPKDRMPAPREILNLCSGLVAVSQVPRGKNTLVHEVRLAHFSVKEYLVSENVSRAYISLVSATMARAYLARLCLTYVIGTSQLWPGWTSAKRNLIFSDFPFLKYAGRRWYDHAREIGTNDEGLWILMISFFLGRVEALSFATYIDGFWYDRDESETANAISYASSCGLTQVVEYLIDKGAGFAGPAANDCLDEPFLRASSKFHNTTIQLLLDRGADVNAGDGFALQHASAWGQNTTVQLLLDRGADVNARDGLALREASTSGHDTIVQLLLRNGADVNARDGLALQEASMHGRNTIIQLLLSHGADVNAGGGLALQKASMHGHYTTVRLLLYHGADVNAGNSVALQHASRRGYDTIVQLLLEHGADVNARNGAALRYASRHGERTIVQLLLDSGADLNIRDKGGITALMEASKQNQYTTMQLLLNRRASFGPQNFIYAFQRDDRQAERLVSIMLPYITAELAAQEDQVGRNILHYAAASGSETVVRRCLDLGVDVDARDERGTTALHWAAEKRHLNVIRMLVNAGSDLGEPDDEGWTPLTRMVEARNWQGGHKRQRGRSQGSSRDSSMENSGMGARRSATKRPRRAV